MKVQFIEKRFSATSLLIIQRSNQIIKEYREKGLKLTLRQLFYQHVARDWIANKQSEYKRLGSVINDARLAGKIDWDAIEDRTRNLQTLGNWDSPGDIIDACSRAYRRDVWATQDTRVECWVEKEALVGVIEQACVPFRTPFFACRGYTSQSEMFDAGYVRFRKYISNGQNVVVIHLGDHDPSGIHMTEDIRGRLEMFMGSDADRLQVIRIALTMPQVEEFNPPPNPAKQTDTRFHSYQTQFGDKSWELDALDPETLNELIQKEISANIDDIAWDKAIQQEDEEKQSLKRISDNYAKVQNFVNNL